MSSVVSRQGHGSGAERSRVYFEVDGSRGDNHKTYVAMRLRNVIAWCTSLAAYLRYRNTKHARPDDARGSSYSHARSCVLLRTHH